MFTHAIVKTPCKNIVHALSTANLGPPDYQKALEQHQAYVEALRQIGLKVLVLAADDQFPDSTFIEDVALLTPRCAVILNPGAPSRNSETAGIREILSQFFTTIETIVEPGTVEGGDILNVGSHYFIGLSSRSNKQGAEQLIRILNKHGFSGSTIRLKQFLHLKSGVSYLEKNTLLACEEFLSRQEFRGFTILPVDESESYAANSLWLNDTVLVPRGFPKTAEMIRNAGYKVMELDVSEFRKADGGLSCLSLRF